jgi:hypothetical protein
MSLRRNAAALVIVAPANAAIKGAKGGDPQVIFLQINARAYCTGQGAFARASRAAGSGQYG